MSDSSKPPSTEPQAAAEPFTTIELPASQWVARVEERIRELSELRRTLRIEIKGPSPELRLCKSNSDTIPSPHRAWLEARANYLGPDWHAATDRLRRANAQIRTARRQLAQLHSQRNRSMSAASPWVQWLWHRPRYHLKAQPLERRLAHARHERRAALGIIQEMRPRALSENARVEIARATEDLLIKTQRTLLRRAQLLQEGRSLGESIATGLALASQLKAMGDETVAMKERTDPEKKETVLPSHDWFRQCP